ncbi:hypothetical protein RF11_08361 [Thelohanellus kitauei]|uniref:Uncharacterized protein n=1 Tax=Thelohanellus kitauei TaxID=669202 RepID=A0A0C2MG12_THEKT|nr:hypothetical protein RF11_08361 [Thelohanellus kitauei]
METEIKIDRCQIIFPKMENGSIITDDMGYSFLLNKYTKYEFSSIYLRLKIPGGSGTYIMFGMYHLIITFTGYTQKYIVPWTTFQTFEAEMGTKSLIYNFEQYGGKYINELDPSFPFENDEKPKPDLLPDKIEKSESNQSSTSNITQEINENPINTQTETQNETQPTFEQNEHNETSIDNNSGLLIEKPTNNETTADNEEDAKNETTAYHQSEAINETTDDNQADAKNETTADHQAEAKNETTADHQADRINETTDYNQEEAKNETTVDHQAAATNETQISNQSNGEVEKIKLNEMHDNNQIIEENEKAEVKEYYYNKYYYLQNRDQNIQKKGFPSTKRDWISLILFIGASTSVLAFIITILWEIVSGSRKESWSMTSESTDEYID